MKKTIAILAAVTLLSSCDKDEEIKELNIPPKEEWVIKQTDRVVIPARWFN